MCLHTPVHARGLGTTTREPISCPPIAPHQRQAAALVNQLGCDPAIERVVHGLWLRVLHLTRILDPEVITCAEGRAQGRAWAGPGAPAGPAAASQCIYMKTQLARPFPRRRDMEVYVEGQLEREDMPIFNLVSQHLREITIQVRRRL